MDLPQIEQQGDQTYLLKGVLNMQTVPALEREAQSLLDGVEGEVCIDFSGVKHADSSGLALLIELQRLARRLGSTVSFVHLPEQLLQIARVSELQDILPIKD